jgi:hypothetical protein
MIAKPETFRSCYSTVSAGTQFTTNCEAVIMAKIVHFGLTAAAAFNRPLPSSQVDNGHPNANSRPFVKVLAGLLSK